MLPALAPEEAQQAARPKQEPSSGLRNHHKHDQRGYFKEDRLYFNFPTCPGHSDLSFCWLVRRVRAGEAGPARGRALRGRHIWAHHRLCIAIGCGSYAAACQQDGLPPPAVLTLIILVSPRTYRNSLCHFKIDSGRAAARSPNKAHMHSDFVHVTDRHSSLGISLQ